MDRYDSTFKGKVEMEKQVYFTTEVDNVPVDGTCVINWTLGNKQRITLDGGLTKVFFDDPEGATTLTIKIIQGAGSGTIDWPSSSKLKWSNGTPPTLTSAISSVDIAGFYFDDVSSGVYWGVCSNGFG